MKALSLTALSAALLLAPASPNPARQPPTPVEQQLADHVDARQGAALALLERVVNINSGTLNLGGVRRVGEVFREQFQALGFEVRWVDGEPFNRAGHLVARRSGSGPRILLIGHLDTVFEPDSPFQRFERVGDTEVRGPGVIDMKGGNVVMLLALEALAAAGRLDALDLTVVLTGDEEKPGEPRELAREALLEAARHSDIALGFEDGDGNPATAVIARRGSASWTLRVRGTPAHSSQIFQPEFGAGAILEAARVLERFRARLAGEADLTFNPGAIVGGTTVEWDGAQARGTVFGKGNVIAGHAVVSGDLRCLSPAQLERAWAAMQAAAADSLAGTRSELALDPGSYPPMAPSEGNRQLLGLYDRVSRDLGLGPVTPVDPRNAGAADISFAAAHVEMALDGLGLMGRDGHTVEETADLRTLASQAQRAAVLLLRLSEPSPGQ